MARTIRAGDADTSRHRTVRAFARLRAQAENDHDVDPQDFNLEAEAELTVPARYARPDDWTAAGRRVLASYAHAEPLIIIRHAADETR
jgi:hypothetical protein